jgi:outer membrane immunogenic protein
MKTLVFVAAVVAPLVAFTPVEAADMRAPVAKAPPMMAQGCAQFGGFYVGGQAGGARYEHQFSDRNAWAGFVDDDLVGDRTNTKWGVAGGVTGGWNWQSRCTVFGIEADYSWSGIKASAVYNDDVVGIDDQLSLSSKLRSFGTIRTRTGIVVDNLMLYVTGGLAFANFKRDFTLVDDGDAIVETFSKNRTRLGWTAGVGTEWAAWGNWSIKSEVLYMRFEKQTDTFFSPSQERNVTFENNDSVWVSRIGLNYRFGGQ